MRLSVLLSLSLLLTSCGERSSKKQNLVLGTSGPTEVVVVGADNASEIYEQAKTLGIDVSGDSILVLKGDSEKIEKLEFTTNENFDYIRDQSVQIPIETDFTPDRKALYLAKKDFGFEEFAQKFPEADGRGVKVGVIDDGISPNQQGFLKTSTGERKFLLKGSQSSLMTFGLSGEIDEAKNAFDGKIDFNRNGKTEKLILKYEAETKKVCIDMNANNTLEDNECKGTFGATGEYFTLADGSSTVLTEVDPGKGEIQLFLPENGTDSHGEGVASVLAGYQIGGIQGFDGVAPGSQIVDYDLSHPTDKNSEREFSIGTLLNALDWVGKNGAEVANISYSLFFASAKTQAFMNKALSEIVKKHNLVVSFSAGNNGPGLGSLNRRGIYPDSVLVAGAYISKELDEHVHGVTGIPDEGRVVYYSSRGPGLGTGPLLISPLSSLTNGTPDRGHLAFNGTSSASPALAGAAALLISALKQNGLPVDAETVVQALRQSGKQLYNEPFIFQGYGLPKLVNAFEIYKQLIAGNKFMLVDATSDSDSSDGVRHRGIFIRTSENDGIVSKRILMAGKASPLATADARINLLTPVRIEYSEGISGANRLWVSTGESRFFIDIDPDAILAGKHEAFGEIRIISDIDNSLMAIVPVTIVNDEVLNRRLTNEFVVGSQDGKRMHFYVPPGVRGFRVNVETIDGEDRYARVSVFDPDQIRTVQKSVGSDLWINVSKPGYYQVGLVINGGSERKLKAKITVDTMNIVVKSKIINAASPALLISNRSSNLSAKLRLTPVSVEVASKIFGPADLNGPGFEIENEMAEGAYRAVLSMNDEADLSYEYSTCGTRILLKDGTIQLQDGTATVPPAGAKVLFRCMPFEKGLNLDNESISWTLRVLSQGSTQEKRLDVARNATARVAFDALKSGLYSVEIQDPITGDIVSLGRIEAK